MAPVSNSEQTETHQGVCTGEWSGRKIAETGKGVSRCFVLRTGEGTWGLKLPTSWFHLQVQGGSGGWGFPDSRVRSVSPGLSLSTFRTRSSPLGLTPALPLHSS